MAKREEESIGESGESRLEGLEFQLVKILHSVSDRDTAGGCHFERSEKSLASIAE